MSINLYKDGGGCVCVCCNIYNESGAPLLFMAEKQEAKPSTREGEYTHTKIVYN